MNTVYTRRKVHMKNTCGDGLFAFTISVSPNDMTTKK